MYFKSQPNILRDFDTFLDYFSQFEQLALTKDKGYLRNADLVKINDGMHNRATYMSPKSQQPVFSLINTFFHIANTAHLFFIKKNTINRTCFLSVNKARIRLYDAMNDDEKYFFLLETFWCYVDWDMAYDCRYFSDGIFYETLIKQPVGKAVSIGDSELRRPGKIMGPLFIPIAEVFHTFGFFNLIWDEKLEKRPSKYSFPYQAAILTDFGKITLGILMTSRLHALWGELDPYYTPEIANRIAKYYADLEPEDEDDELLWPAFPLSETDLLPDDTDDEEQPFETSFLAAFQAVMPDMEVGKQLLPFQFAKIQGVYTLRISLNNTCYREIAINGNKTLQDLHEAIQNLFGFDDDHLYAFYINGVETSRNGQGFMDPRGLGMAGGKPANLFELCELGLFPGKEILYIFDFGDHWQFFISVLAIEPDKEVADPYKMLKKVGRAPRQYGGW